MEPSGAHPSGAFRISLEEFYGNAHPSGAFKISVEEMSSEIKSFSYFIAHISQLIKISPTDRDKILNILENLNPRYKSKAEHREFKKCTDFEILEILPRALESYYNLHYSNLRDYTYAACLFTARLKESKEIILSLLPEEKSLPYLLERRLEVLQKCHEDLEDFLSHDHTIKCQHDLLGNDDTIPTESASTKLIRIIEAVKPEECHDQLNTYNISELVTLALQALKDNPKNLAPEELEQHIVEFEDVLMTPYLRERKLKILQKRHKDLKDRLVYDHIIANESISQKLIIIIEAVKPDEYYDQLNTYNISELITLALQALEDHTKNLSLEELKTHIIELENILMKSNKQLGIESDSEENEPEIEISFEGTETDQETEIESEPEDITMALEALKDNPENLDLKELETHIVELDNILMKSNKQLGIESDSEENEPEIEISFEGTETDQETEIESEPEDITTEPTSLTQTTAQPAASKQNKGSSHCCIIL